MYRRFTKILARVIAPLNEFLCKGNPKEFTMEPTDEQLNAFGLLNDALTEPLVLKLPE